MITLIINTMIIFIVVIIMRIIKKNTYSVSPTHPPEETVVHIEPTWHHFLHKPLFGVRSGDAAIICPADM